VTYLIIKSKFNWGYVNVINLAKTVRIIIQLVLQLTPVNLNKGIVMTTNKATPAEGTSYRLARIDKEKYPDIICANEVQFRVMKAEPFYTNSTHLPVDFTDDLFEVLEHQDDLQQLYTGGTVLHLFIGERIHDTEAVKTLVKRVCQRFHLPYFTITPTFSICPSDGYLSGEHLRCPYCDAETEIYSRIVGYLRPVKQWNIGKKEEFKLRKEFDLTCV